MSILAAEYKHRCSADGLVRRALIFAFLLFGTTGCHQLLQKGAPAARYETSERALGCSQRVLEELGYVITVSTGPNLALRDDAIRGTLVSRFTNTTAVVSVLAGRPLRKTWYELRVMASSYSNTPGSQSGILHHQAERAVIDQCGAARNGTGAALERAAD